MITIALVALLVSLTPELFDQIVNPESEALPSIEGGDILRGRNLSQDDQVFSDPVRARVGDTLQARLRVHAPYKALPRVGVSVAGTTIRSHTPSLTVTVLSSDASPFSTSDALKIRTVPPSHVRMSLVPGTVKSFAMFGHSDDCPEFTEPAPLPDTIADVGIAIGPVGFEDLEDECSERTVFVDFQVNVVPAGGTRIPGQVAPPP